VLDAGAGDAHRVDFLEGVLPDHGGGDLAGEDHHGDGVAVGGGNAGDGVGRAGAGGDERHAHFAACARVAVGGVHRGLLVAYEHVPDLVLLEEGIVDVQDRAAGVAEDVFDVFALQALDDDFGAGEEHGGIPRGDDPCKDRVNP
jgi:hypothetical protein